MYVSKNDIFKDFQIAIKFEVDFSKRTLDARKDTNEYTKLYDQLKTEHLCKIETINNSIKNFNRDYPLSTGLFVEIPVEDSNGESIGSRFLFLEHETGWEIFFKLVLDKIKDKILDKALDKLIDFIKEEWPQIMPLKIQFVEIRTEKKGVMRLKLEDFHKKNLECLIKRFEQINHISETNNDCFKGRLFDPKGKEVKRADD